jgi:hypothetical protein
MEYYNWSARFAYSRTGDTTMWTSQGDPVHGEIIATNASGAGVALSLFDAGKGDPTGAIATRTLGANEYLHITDILFISTAGGAYDFVAKTVADGRHIAKGNAAVLGGLAHHFETPYSCPKGVVPVLIAAGQVDLLIQGYITQV